MQFREFFGKISKEMVSCQTFLLQAKLESWIFTTPPPSTVNFDDSPTHTDPQISMHICENMRYRASIYIAVWQPLVAIKSCLGKNHRRVQQQPPFGEGGLIIERISLKSQISQSQRKLPECPFSQSLLVVQKQNDPVTWYVKSQSGDMINGIWLALTQL